MFMKKVESAKNRMISAKTKQFFLKKCELPEKCPLNRFWVKYRI